MWELRGPFGEHRGYVQPVYDVSGLGYLLILGMIGTGIYYGIEAIFAIVNAPGNYAWIHVISAHLYYYTIIAPAMGVMVVWNLATSLTPWGNLNFIIALIAVPTYIFLAIVLIIVGWLLIWKEFLRQSPGFIYLLPAMLSGLWEAGRWLFA